MGKNRFGVALVVLVLCFVCGQRAEGQVSRSKGKHTGNPGDEDTIIDLINSGGGGGGIGGGGASGGGGGGSGGGGGGGASGGGGGGFGGGGLPGQCGSTPCYSLLAGGVRYGSCYAGIGSAADVCSSRSLELLEGASGCNSGQFCHCCIEPEGASPPPPPSPPVVPISPTRPVLPDLPGNCGLRFCALGIDDETIVFGSCFSGTNNEDPIATCAKQGGLPALGAVGCSGLDSNCICCIDSAALCTGQPKGNCASGECACIATETGASCNAPVYPDYRPPPSNGGGCQENLCNAVAEKSGLSAGCCPFCP
eukprot:jgi/Picsp_1/5375/NSC_02736-R1_---NA---